MSPLMKFWNEGVWNKNMLDDPYGMERRFTRTLLHTQTYWDTPISGDFLPQEQKGKDAC